MKNVIIVCGLNGAGKSTLGKALAEELNYRFIDMEDIYFPKDDPNYMYSNPRPFEEVERILLNIISENDSFVLASVKGNFNKDIVSHFKCTVYIETLKETRMKRVYEQSYNKFGERMLEGGDLYEKKRHSSTLLNLKMKTQLKFGCLQYPARLSGLTVLYR